MFRTTKKRPRKQQLRVSREDENEEDEVIPTKDVVKRPQKVKKLLPVIRSFEVEEEESTKSKKRRKRRGLGYGGGVALAEDDNNDAKDEPSHPEAPSLYGKDSLNQLKSEQLFRKSDPQDTVTPDSEPKDSVENSYDGGTNKTQPLPAYIPLLNKEDTIMTGDEAALYEIDTTGEPSTKDGLSKKLEATDGEPPLEDDPEHDETTAAWEEQVARRAGIPHVPPPPRQASAPTQAPSLSRLRGQLTSTLQQLKTQQYDLQRAQERRQGEVEQTQAEVDRQEAELKEAGTALEYYQQLRGELVSWVGALRNLQTKIEPIREAWMDLESERSHKDRWETWEDDTIAVLREAGCLDRVLGRQPPPTEEPSGGGVDEFGRDVQSLQVRQREKRLIRFQRIREQRPQVRQDDSDAFVSDGEKDEFQDRREALQKAMYVALSEVDEEYTSQQNLLKVFKDWEQKYGEEYRQCFAGLSLADLMSVFVQADCCETCNPLHWLDKKEADASAAFAWATQLKSAETANEDESPVNRVIEKAILPSALGLLEKNAYNLTSSKQTRSFATLYSRSSALLQSSSVLDPLTKRLLDYIQTDLESLSIPILTQHIPALKEVQVAYQAATEGQVHRIKKIILNILRYWAPILPSEKLGAGVLDFVSSKLLFLLSSLRAHGNEKEVGAIFAEVYQALKQTDWLDRMEWMLHAAPIRAAAIAYQI